MSLLVVPFLLSMNIFVHVGFVIAERNLYLSVVGHSLLVAKGAYNLVNGEIFIGYLEIEILLCFKRPFKQIKNCKTQQSPPG